MGGFLYFIVDALLGLMGLAIIAQVVMSWLLAFEVVNLRHPFVRQVAHFLDAATAPVLRPLQRIIPSIGGLDISPLIALLLIQAIRGYLLPWAFQPLIAMLHG